MASTVFGDRCLSFHFKPEFLETVAAEIPGARAIAFTVPRLPPHPALLPVIAAAEAALVTTATAPRSRK